MSKRTKRIKFTTLWVNQQKTVGRYADAGCRGLYLQVKEAADETGVSRSWLLRFMKDHRARTMGLGPVDLVPLADARERAIAARRQLLDGMDPIEARREHRMQARLDAAKTISFREAAGQCIAAMAPGWRRSGRHAEAWTQTLERHVYPVFGDVPVGLVDTALVMKMLEAFWHTRTVTANRVRSRVEQILDWARARGYRDGENPARWKGHLDALLAKPGKVRKVEHLAAMAYSELPAFLVELRRETDIPSKALEFAILTAARSGEIRLAKWGEVDLHEKVWSIAPERTKANRLHRIPLSDRAVELLLALPRGEGDDLVFTGRDGKPLSHSAMLRTLARLGRPDLTAHGFRSSFRDWAAEQTNFPREIAEAALGHALKDKVEAAYQRTDLLEKRRRLMTEWERFCASPPRWKGGSNVVDMRR